MITNEEIELLVTILNDHLRGDVKDEKIEKLHKKLELINELNKVTEESAVKTNELRKMLYEIDKVAEEISK